MNQKRRKHILLISGCAGFIGSKLAELRLECGDDVIDVDSLNDTSLRLLKERRLAQLRKFCLASRSSIYGKNKIPFYEDRQTDRPPPHYAASKKGAGSLAFTYLYDLDIAIPRCFTACASMSVFQFTYHIAKGFSFPLYL